MQQKNQNNRQGELIFGIFASLAQFESALISERVKAGMERARTQGKPLGRPRIPNDIKYKIQILSGVRPVRFFAAARPEGSGVTVHDRDRVQPGVTLLSGFKDGVPAVWLIDANGKILHKWPGGHQN